MRRLALLMLLLAPSLPRPVGACSPALRDGGWHSNDPAYATDTVAPSAVMASATVERSTRDDGGSVGCNTSCGPAPGYIVLRPTATDDRAGLAQLGFKLAIASGQPPRGLDVSQVLLIESYSGEIGLRFDNDAAPFSFDLELRAVDLNGNEGPPTVITIEG